MKCSQILNKENDRNLLAGKQFHLTVKSRLNKKPAMAKIKQRKYNDDYLVFGADLPKDIYVKCLVCRQCLTKSNLAPTKLKTHLVKIFILQINH